MRIAAYSALFFSVSLAVAAPAEPKPNGQSIFFSNCAVCHGMDGSGGRGPNLLGTLHHGERDADIAEVIRHGVPGSSMPAFHLDDDELAALLKYVGVMRHGAPPQAHHGGDAVAGEAIYRRNGCSGCHRIGSSGSIFGPDLTRIGAARSYEYLKASILDPSADVPNEYQAVTVITRDNKRVRGLRVNEDTFFVQLRLPDQSFVSFEKAKTAGVIDEKNSFMPRYAIHGKDLENLLAYLGSLSGRAAASETRQQPKLR